MSASRPYVTPEGEARLAFERIWWRNGCLHVAGVDEVGRGSLAGPVVAAAVILSPDAVLPGVRDSKMLSALQRETLAPLIQAQAVALHIALVDAAEIDRVNILQATMRCMEAAVAGLDVAPEVVLVDGNRAPAVPQPVQTIVRGDQRSLTIGAASILAKVYRDELMRRSHVEHPAYAFDANKGYASPAHVAAIQRFGLCPLHRRTFCRKIMNRTTQLEMALSRGMS